MASERILPLAAMTDKIGQCNRIWLPGVASLLVSLHANIKVVAGYTFRPHRGAPVTKHWSFRFIFLPLAVLTVASLTRADDPKPRARDLGIPLEGTPGPHNAITDVKGVAVGHTTLISGEGKLKVGAGPVRTGVTAILPRGRKSTEPVFAGWFSLNGNGEMTGTTWIEESGFLEGPVLLTNTSSVGTVRDAVVKWWISQGKTHQPWVLPVVAETYDGYLNDTDGFHVKEKHVFDALDQAKDGTVPEGNVGGGTGMTCFEFAGGIGTASRRIPPHPTLSPKGRGKDAAGAYTLGVLVQANFGLRPQLRVAGVPVGKEIKDHAFRSQESGSIIIVIATDAPLLPHQLKRLARRASMGLARTGSVSGNGSGDIFLAFSTANAGAAKADGVAQLTMLPNDRMNALFEATVQATEEAILNALVGARTMIGRDDHKAIALPHDRLKEIMQKHQRLSK
jgi:D-aminopeptidase